MKAWLLGLLIIPVSTLALELTNDANRDLLSKPSRALLGIYIKGIKKTVEKYNQNASSKFLKMKLASYSFNVDANKLPKKLPKLEISKGSLIIKEIAFEYNFQSFLNENFRLGNKTYSLKCEREAECFYDFVSQLSPAKTSFLPSLIGEAIAQNNFEKLMERDYLILGALTVLNESIQELPGMFSSKQEKLAIKNANIQKLYESIEAQNIACQDKIDSYQNGRGDSFYDPATYDSQFDLIAKIVSFEDLEDVEGQIESFLGDDVVAHTDMDGLFSSLTRKTAWKDYLTCDKLLYVQAQKYGNSDQVLPKFCERQTCAGNAKTISPSKEIQNYCKSYDELKFCLMDYYAAVVDVDNKGRYDDEYSKDKLKSLREDIQEARALQE